MNGKKLLKEKLGLLLTLLVVVTVGAAVSFGIKRKNAEEDGTDTAASASTADTASGTTGEETYENQDSSMEKDKTETVYIKSDAEGNTKEITVETMLKLSLIHIS